MEGLAIWDKRARRSGAAILRHARGSIGFAVAKAARPLRARPRASQDERAGIASSPRERDPSSSSVRRLQNTSIQGQESYRRAQHRTNDGRLRAGVGWKVAFVR